MRGKTMQYISKDDYILCKCNTGKFLIDEADLDIVKPYGWHVSKNGYVVRNNDKKTLHSIIMQTPKGKVTDHINGDKLDNRRKNLRVVGYSENGYNKIPAFGKSGEPFIAYDKNKKYYHVVIDGIYRGGSKDLEQAKQIREKALVGSNVKKFSRFFQE